MAENDLCSSISVNGSADELAPSPTIYGPKTPADIEAEKAMAHERERRFMADTSSPFAIVNIHEGGNKGMAPHREDTVVAAIKTFDGAFAGKKKGENRGAGGTRRGRK